MLLSPVGKTGVSTISDLGAPSGWQVMAFGTMEVSSCHGADEGTLQHEMLHALGVEHEHSRPEVVTNNSKRKDKAKFNFFYWFPFLRDFFGLCQLSKVFFYDF